MEPPNSFISVFEGVWEMRFFLITMAMVLFTGLAVIWVWIGNSRFALFDREYPMLVAKKQLMDQYSQPGLAIFGDSAPLAGILPEKLNPTAVNFALGGRSPVEDYFFIRRLMRQPVHPKAVLLSFGIKYFIYLDTMGDRGIKMGLLSDSDVNEIYDYALKFNDPAFLSGLGPLTVDGRLTAFLSAHSFPPYYVSYMIQTHFKGRWEENYEVLRTILQSKGQFTISNEDGSKRLNDNTRLTGFNLSPVIDHYFRATLRMLEEEGIPVYYISMPMNEVSEVATRQDVLDGYKNYLENIAQEDPQFHILSNLENVYPWTYFGDEAHLNEKGSNRFTEELARILNEAGVPGGPYGVPERKDDI
jgi:hypothetical protein